MSWELSSNGGSSWTSFAAAGLAAARRTLVINGEDAFTFQAASATSLTDTPAYAYGSTLIVRRNDGATNPRWFYGRVVAVPQFGEARRERTSYQLAGPWWYLAHCTYMQSWRVYDTAGSELTNVNKCRVVLCQDAAGARATTGAQIEDALDWAISRGAPIAKGTIDPGITLPFDERDNLSCADVILTMLRWLPTYVCWFDHSTAPYPTFHCRARANLTAASVALAGAGIRVLAVTPRNDLQVPGVSIVYEKTHQVDDKTYNTIETDVAGNPSALDTVHAVFDLQGSSATYLKQRLVTEDFPEDLAANKAWWKARVPWLQAVADEDLTIAAGARALDSELPRILIEGNIPDWLNKDVEQEVVSCEVTAVIRDEADNIVERLDRKVEVIQLTVTDASTGTYRRLESWDSGEATPSGVAAALYAAWNSLQYEGSMVLKAEECAGAVAPGKALNISGGRTAWATMAALVRRLDEDLDAGESQVSFGPDARLEADSLVALFRALRSRRYSWRAPTRTSGDRGAGDLTLGGKAPARTPGGGPGEKRLLVVQDEVSSTHQEIRLDPAQIEFEHSEEAAAQVIRPREVLVPEIDAETEAVVARRRQVICGAPYGTAVPLTVPEDLLNVLITDPALGQILYYDADAENPRWRNSVVGTLAEGDLLRWDATAAQWVKITPAEVTVVISVDYDDETGELTMTRQAVKVVSAAAAGEPEEIATAEPCPT